MQRYIIHLDNKGFTINDAKNLLNKARSLSLKGSIIRDARVAHTHIEFDVSIEREKIKELLNHFEEISSLKRCIEIDEKNLEKDKAIRYARELFNEERYWECHEVLEGVWKNSKNDEKYTIQGIILIAAAFVHIQKEEIEIACNIFKRAIPKLRLDKYKGIEVVKLREIIDEIITNKKIIYFKI